VSVADYTLFTEQGRPDRDALASLLDRVRRSGIGSLGHAELEDLAARHRRVVSDYAWARSRYPGTRIERELSRLAFAGHRVLLGGNESWVKQGLRYLRRGYPRAFRDSLDTVGVALGIFALFTLLGFIVTVSHPDMAAIFVGAEAAEDLRRGAIWTDQVAAMAPASVLSSAIFTNNISVALLAWSGGVLWGLGSLYLLVFNGLMFGSILSITWRYGLFDRLGAFIAGHGPLELFLIVVAAAAGLELARGTLSDENEPRRRTVARAGRRSLRLVGGTLPWFVLLGVVEGNISPQMWVPTSAKLALGVMLLGGFILYAMGQPRRNP